MLGRLAPFGNQLVNDRLAWPDMLPHQPLSSLDALFQRGDSQFVAFHPQHHFIADVYAQRFAKSRWYYHATVLVDALARFRSICHFVLKLSLYEYLSQIARTNLRASWAF
jgi:hypothetical protein